jgi:hypothetical protein
MVKKRVIKSRRKPGTIELARWVEDPKDHLLSRFVVDVDGKKIAESISVDGNRLIIKRKTKFYSIPLNAVTSRGMNLFIKRELDWAAAEALGERWRKRSYSRIAIRRRGNSRRKVIKSTAKLDRSQRAKINRKKRKIKK